MEELVWASSFELGYQKHPPLPSWLLYPATLLFGKAVWLTFAMGFACIFVAQIFIFKLFSDIVGRSERSLPIYAPLLALLAASPIAYYTVRGADFNHNAAQLWSIAGLILVYYRAWVLERAQGEGVRRRLYLNWGALGLLGGLALLSKYSVLIQIAVLGLHFLWVGRWKNKDAWLGLLLAIAILAAVTWPHFHWVIEQASLGQGPLKYAEDSIQSDTSRLGLFIDLLLNFGLTQIYRLTPMIVVIFLIIILGIKKQKFSLGSSAKAQNLPLTSTTWWSALRKEDRVFLLFMSLGPVLLAFCIGTLLNIKIESKWAVTFFLTIGSFAWMFVSREICWPRFWGWVLILHLVFAAGYGIARGPLVELSGKTSRVNYPSEALASILFERWSENLAVTHGEPLELVVGDTWTAGNVMIHGADKGRSIKVWIDADDLISPWIKDSDRKKTKLIVIDRTLGGEPVSPMAEKLYQSSQIKGHESITWSQAQNAKKLEIDWAIVQK